MSISRRVTGSRGARAGPNMLSMRSRKFPLTKAVVRQVPSAC